MPRSRLARLEAKALAAGLASGPSNGRLPLKRGMGARRGASPCDTRRSATRASSHLQKAQVRFVEAGAGPALSIPHSTASSPVAKAGARSRERARSCQRAASSCESRSETPAPTFAPETQTELLCASGGIPTARNFCQKIGSARDGTVAQRCIATRSELFRFCCNLLRCLR